jgi:thiamine biosynthesis lipoprotein
LSQQVSENSDGYFDITVGPLVRSWGFFKKKGLDLTKKQVDSLLQYVGCHKIQIQNNELVKESPLVIVDLNAIAQGYTDDLVANLFIQKGIKNYLIEIGGEVRASGTKENNVLWMVGIEKPAADENADQVIQDKVQLKDLSLATSGNYRKYFIKDGVKYSHTIDPKTGYPVHHSLLSVTVVANTCALADAYATAFMVMGLDKAKATLAKHPEMHGYFIYSDSLGKYKTEYTQGFESLLAK